MKLVQPKVFIIGESRVVNDGLSALLEELGVPAWTTDAYSDAEMLTEVAGKLCYMSFDTSLNKNLTKTGTRDNHDYIQKGLIEVKHGSTLEHTVVNIVLTNVSRVLTHELVRHRVGVAYSQVSGRYVRTDDLPFWIPSIIRKNPKMKAVYEKAIVAMEGHIAELTVISGIDEMTGKDDFSLKKKLTSAFRRIVGNGQANHIMVSANHRTLRHMIEQRTSRHAEEEIRVVFSSLAEILESRYPAIYADMKREMVEDIPEITFGSSKV